MAPRRNVSTPAAAATGIGLVLVALTAPAVAEEASAAPADVATGSENPDSSDNDDSGGAFLAAGKVGGIFSFNGLNPFVTGGVELGYVFSALDRGIGALIAVDYTAPKTDGKVTEDFDPARIPGGAYDWEIRQKILTVQPTFLYRMTFISDSITPYVGVGPRIYFLQSVVRGSAGDQKFADTTEQSTKFGIGGPLGAEFALGPGGIIAEVLLQWAPIDHRATGTTNLGGATLNVGYRALF